MSSDSGDAQCVAVGAHLGQAVFQHVAMKIQRIFRRFRVVRDCEVLVSVACVRKLVALAFITQSERIQASRSLEPAIPTSGGHTEGPEGLGRLWLCASSLGHGEADTA